jgi:hypothetical protein
VFVVGISLREKAQQIASSVRRSPEARKDAFDSRAELVLGRCYNYINTTIGVLNNYKCCELGKNQGLLFSGSSVFKTSQIT